jgi:hypothetical protein
MTRTRAGEGPEKPGNAGIGASKKPGNAGVDTAKKPGNARKST